MLPAGQSLALRYRNDPTHRTDRRRLLRCRNRIARRGAGPGRSQSEDRLRRRGAQRLHQGARRRIRHEQHAQLDEWGLAPASAATEADLRSGIRNIEAADARFDNGYILVGYVPRTSCAVQIEGEGRIAARDALIRMLLDTGMDYRESTTPKGDQLLHFPFSKHPIFIYTSTAGNVMVQIR